MIRILIYGGRDYDPDGNEFDWLSDIFADWSPDELIVVSGHARGADVLGEAWALENRMGLDIHPADWQEHGKAAGAIRNSAMLASGLDYAVEFPGGRGTADMRRKLDKAKVKVFEYRGA